MHRRNLFKGIAGVAAGLLVLPPTLLENTEAVKRYWALDRTMVSRHHMTIVTTNVTPEMRIRDFAAWVESKDVRDTPFTDWYTPGGPPYYKTTIDVRQSYAPFIETVITHA